MIDILPWTSDDMQINLELIENVSTGGAILKGGGTYFGTYKQNTFKLAKKNVLWSFNQSFYF